MLQKLHPKLLATGGVCICIDIIVRVKQCNVNLTFIVGVSRTWSVARCGKVPNAFHH
jgi:hypothetical protein